MARKRLDEPPYPERHVWWCERTRVSHSLLLDLRRYCLTVSGLVIFKKYDDYRALAYLDLLNSVVWKLNEWIKK